MKQDIDFQNPDLKSLIDFVNFSHDIRKVKRIMWVKGEEDFENDSEHAYQLALTALYIIDQDQLTLDPFRAMGLALVHDILEVYAGDTPIFGHQELLATKEKRESEAIQTLRKKWPKFALLHTLIDEYEARKSPESIFVYALDKLLPIINNYVDEGRNWQKQGVDLKAVIKAKAGKIDLDERINMYYQKLLELLKERPELFAE